MYKIKITVLLLGALWLCSSVWSQTNLVPNPSFEDGSPDPTTASQLDSRCSDWKNFNTSDWYKKPSFSQFYFDQFQFSYSLSAHTGQGYIGFGGCEGAQAKLIEEVEPGSYVRVSLWFTPREHSDSEINIYLLHEKAPDDALEDCFNPNIEFEFIATVEVNAGGADATHEPGTWYQFTSGELFVAKKPYKWIAIKGENNVGAFGDPNYVYVDDVSAIKYPECEHECAPDLPTVKFVTTSGLPNAINTQFRDFIYVEHATKVLFQVFNQWGNLIYELKAADPSGLVNRSGIAQNGNSYNLFAIEWEGTDENGQYLIFQDEYKYVVTISNCNSIRTETGSVILPGFTGYPPGQTQQMAYPDYIVNTPPSCCIENWVYQNEAFPQEFVEIKEVNDFIHLGEEIDPNRSFGPVVFESGSETYLNAGSEVTFFQGVTIKTGAIFRAELGYECPPGKRDLSYAVSNQATFGTRPLEKRLPTLQKIKLFPNPSNGQFEIGYSLSENSTVKVLLQDNMGRQVRGLLDDVYQEPGAHTLNVSLQDVPDGFYHLIFRVNEMQLTKKLIKRRN